jgi:hypothetical protein
MNTAIWLSLGLGIGDGMEGNRHSPRLSRLGSGWDFTATAVVPHAVNSITNSRTAASSNGCGGNILDGRLGLGIDALQFALEEPDLFLAVGVVLQVLLYDRLIVGVL